MTNLLNALLIAMIIEGALQRIFNRSRNPLKPGTVRKAEFLCLVLITSSLFTYSYLTFSPYYEYPYDSRYIDASLWFRDYLDQQDPSVNNILYSGEDPILPYPLSLICNSDRTYGSLCCNVTTTFVDATFITNPTNTIKYLVIFFNNINATTAADLRTAYVGSSYEVYHNTLILILKFPVI